MKRSALLVLLILCCGLLAAQDTLRGDYVRLVLKPGTYVISGTVRVDSALLVSEGVSLLFAEEASLVCMGSVTMNGLAQNRIVLQSMTAKKGNGMVIKGQRDQSEVRLRFVRFVGLLTAIRFESDWTRKLVSIGDCEFLDNNFSAPVVTVLSPRYEAGLINPLIPFDLERSVFYNNSSSVYFEDLVANNLVIRITNNLFYGNRLFDYGIYNFSGNVLYGRADKKDPSYSVVLQGNSFLQNYLVSILADTIQQHTSVGVFGSTDSVMASRNFWGYTDLTAIRAGIYDYFINYTAPRLLIEPFLTEPSSFTPAHIYRICALQAAGQTPVVCSLLENEFDLRTISTGVFELKANKPLLDNGVQFVYTYLDDSLKVQTLMIDATLKPLNGGESFQVQLDSLPVRGFDTHPGFLAVDGFRDREGGTVPRVVIGFGRYLSEKNKRMAKQANKTTISSFVVDSSFTARSIKRDTVIVQRFRKSRLYLIAGGNVSSQVVHDNRPLQSYVFPIGSINDNSLRPGFLGAIRFDQALFKPIALSVQTHFTYLRSALLIQQQFDTLLPFANRFTSFLPRSIFLMAGVKAGLTIAITPSLSVLGGRALDRNVRTMTRTDTDSASYRQSVQGIYAGIEVALPSKTPHSSFRVGLQWRHWGSSIAVKDVSNKMDLVDLYMAWNIIARPINDKKSKK